MYMFWSILKYCIKYHYQILYQMLSIGALFPQNHQLEMADFPPNILMPSPLSADLPNWVFRSLKTSLFPPLFVGSLFQSSMFKSLSRVWEPAPEGETCFSRETFCIFAIRQFAKQRLAEKCCQRWYTSSKRWLSVFRQDFPQKMCEEENLIESGGEQKHFEANGVERVKDLRYDGY